MNTSRAALAVAVAVCLQACPASHPDENDAGADAGLDARDLGDVGPDAGRPNVDATRRLVDLGDGDWSTLCNWREGLMTPTAYCCDGTTIVTDLSRCPTGSGADSTAEQCLNDEVGNFWRTRGSDCTVTVEMWETCAQAVAGSARCPLAIPTACDAVWCDEASDAGVPPDGGL